MEKRYQVFVSSTYEDLQEERKAVMQALLELDCIPAGMELFPASSEEQWSLIKRVIDDSDYYVLILAGRYGSCNDDGMGYTEMEYRYAVKIGKPVISFLHKMPGKISAEKTEDTPEGKEKLTAFRKLAQTKMVKYWTNADNLGKEVIISMVKLQSQFPAVGWIRGDHAADEKIYRQLLDAQSETRRLEKELKKIKSQAPIIPENLARGEDKVTIYFRYDITEKKGGAGKYALTWDEIFKAVSPALSGGCTTEEMGNCIADSLSMCDEYLFYDIHIAQNSIQKVRIQLMALGLIRVGNERGIWVLTDYGEREMARLLAEHRLTEDESIQPEAVLV